MGTKALVLAFGALVRPSRSEFVTSILSLASQRRPAGAPHLSTKSAPLRSLALLSVLCAASAADAQQRGVGGWRFTPRPPVHHGPFLGFPGVYVIERDVVHVVEREVVKEVPAAPPPEPPPPPRKPYKIGASYDTLPSGCIKMIQDGASYYLCSGEWYRQVGGESGVSYKAVKAP